MFFDGRNDLNGAGFVKDYLTLIEAKPDWEDVARKYGFTVALVPGRSTISAALAESGQ